MFRQKLGFSKLHAIELSDPVLGVEVVDVIHGNFQPEPLFMEMRYLGLHDLRSDLRDAPHIDGLFVLKQVGAGA